MKRRALGLQSLLTSLLLASSVGIAMAQQAQDSTPPSSAKKEWVIVKGEVRKSIRIELRGRIRLSEALALAGGITERAQGTIRVEHTTEATAGNVHPEISVYQLTDLARAKSKANPYLQPGDVVTVVRRN